MTKIQKKDKNLRTQYSYDASRKGRAAMGDIIGAFGDIPTSFKLALFEIRDKYARSGIGPIWGLLINLFLIAGYYAVGQYIFKVESNSIYYLCHVGTGIIFWQYIVSAWGESTNVISSNVNLLNNQYMNKASLLNVVFLKQSLVLAYSLPLLFICQFALGVFSRPPADIAIYFGSVVLNIFLVYLFFFPFFGIWMALKAKYDDMVYLVTVMTQLLFFVTPVIWIPPNSDEIGFKIITLGNPFYHCLALLRAPFMGEVPPAEVYIGIGAFIVIAWIAFLGIYRWAHSRIMFWI